eukprot:TRINITY_DN675_c0_g1_i1.p1 TRINITY_DN675_c0_g1~~TRINITY_DN675_c0_g1_i1.p1  ORF type:complete len:194 (+),score=30.95 TRINITY_DN675_c0_g1_i1:69-584(+)
MATEQQMQAWFQKVDADRSGFIDHKELQIALGEAQIVVSLMTANMIMRLFDSGRQGRMTYNDFRNLFAWMATKDQAFYQFDTNRDGSLDSREVYNACCQCFPHLQLDQHAFGAATAVYDVDQNGTMSRVEFIAFCAYLEHCSRTYASFDPHRTGNVSMPISQFIYACAQCK